VKTRETDRHKTPGSRQAVRFLILGAVSLVSFSPIVIAVANMRLLGDDYILAAYASAIGPVSSVVTWSTFYASPLFSTYMFMHGWWFTVAPEWLQYAPSFLITAGLAALSGWTVMRVVSGVRWPWFVSIAVAVSFLPMWVLAMGNLGGEYDAVTLLAQINWVSSTYRGLLAYTYFFIVLALVFRLRILRRFNRSLPILLGVVFSFVALNPLPDLLAYGTTSLALATLLALDRSHFADGTSTRAFIYLAIGQAIGIVLLFLSPGSRGRRQWLDFPPPGDPVGAYVQQLMVFMREAANPSLAVVLIGVASLTLIVSGLPNNQMDQYRPQLRVLVLGFALLAVLLVLTGSTNVLLAPGAVWHRWGLQVVVYLLVVLCGVWIGSEIHRRARVPSVVAVSIASVTVLIGLLPSLTVNSLLSDRATNWNERSSALLYIWDREMFPDCWAVLSQSGGTTQPKEFVPVNPCRNLIP